MDEYEYEYEYEPAWLLDTYDTDYGYGPVPRFPDLLESEQEYEYEYGGISGMASTGKYDYLNHYTFAMSSQSPLMLAKQKAKQNPLTGSCELTCLKLNLLHDGGFNVVCDETTAFNDWPFCDGDPAKDDLFHMRQCVLTCRQDEGDSGCPNVHSRGNDKRGCEAGKAFKNGMAYEFVTKFGDTIIFHSLVTHAPTRVPTPLLNETASPTASPTFLETLVTKAPSTVDTGIDIDNVTAEPTMGVIQNETGHPSAGPDMVTNATGRPTVGTTSGDRAVTTPQDSTELIKYIAIPIALVFGVVFVLLVGCYVHHKRAQPAEEAEAEQGPVEEVVRETGRALQDP